MQRFFIFFVLILLTVSQRTFSQSIPKSLYIVNTLGENLSGINLDNQAVNQNSLTLGLYTNEVKISGNKGYVINSGVHEIQVFNLANMTTTANIHLGTGTNPYNMDFINDSLAAISLLISNQVAIVNVNTGQIEQHVTVGNGPEGVKYYNGKIYVTNTGFNGSGYDPGTVSVIDAISQTVVDTINVGLNPQSVDFDGNGNLIIACTGDYASVSSQVDIIDLTADTVLNSINFSTSITSAKVNSANKLYVSTFGFGVMVYNLNTQTFERGEGNTLPGGPGLIFDNQNNCYIVDFNKDSLRAYSAEHILLNSYLIGDGPVSVDIYNPAINGIEKKENILPNKMILYQNFPNPFNPVTQIRFYLPNPGNVQLTIFNLLGKRVYFESQNNIKAGYNLLAFDGGKLASGIYYYQLQAGSDIQTRRMLLIK